MIGSLCCRAQPIFNSAFFSWRERVFDPKQLIVPKREIRGISAILLPVSNGTVDWIGFDSHVERTLAAGLQPAVNMDTGYANLNDHSTRLEVLERTQNIAGGKDFVAGVFVSDGPDSAFDPSAYSHGIEEIQSVGGTPIFFQSYGLINQSDDDLIDAYQRKIEGHELHDGAIAVHGRTRSDSRKTQFRNWGVDHAFGTKLI